MKPPAVPAVQDLPARAPARLAPQLEPLPFPLKGRRVSELRKLRDRLFKEGRLDVAVSVAENITRADPGRESFFRLGFLYREAGRYRDALRMFRDALRFRSGATFLIPEIHLHAGYTWFLLGRTKEMGEALRRAYDKRPKPRSAPAFHLSLGNLYFSKRRYRDAFGEYERAESAFGTPLGRGRAAKNQGLVMLRSGRLSEAERHLNRAILIFKRAGLKDEMADARNAAAAVHLDQGHFERALGMFFRAALDFRNVGKVALEAQALQNAGYAAGEAGAWPRARALLSRAIRLASTTGRSDLAARAYACRATACAHDEDFAQAAENLGLAQRLLRGKRDWIGSLHVYRTQARIAALFGYWKETWRWARRAERLAKKVGDLPRVVEFRNLRARAENEMGRKRACDYARKRAADVAALQARPNPSGDGILQQAARLAATRLPVLIVGESGTGKSDLAREIHARSRRAGKRYVVAPCEQLSFPESDLAGHVEGAWSGARKQSSGLVRQAAGGTLLLDRVDELPAEAQKVLLRMVEGYVRAVGSPHEERLDVRVLATCQKPERLIPDLRARLSGAVLVVSPLRDRVEEFPTLVEKMLRGRRRITCDAVAELARAPWEGNLPELGAAIERMVAASEDPIGLKLVRRILKSPEVCRHRRLVDKKRRLAEMASALV